MVSFVTVNYKTTFYANILISSLPQKWREENEIIIVDNSHDLRLDFDNIKIIQGIETTHASGLKRGLEECKSNTVIISDIDCILIDPNLLNILTKFIEDGGSMIQSKGDHSFKPFQPCFGALNKKNFISEKLEFNSKGYIEIPDDWEGFFGIDSRVKKEKRVYLDVGVDSAYQLMRRGYKVSTIPKSKPSVFFNSIKKSVNNNGWWYGFEKPQVWHAGYGGSYNRFLKKWDVNVWEEKMKIAKLILNNTML